MKKKILKYPRKIDKKINEKIYKFRKKICLGKICKITGLELPKEFKKYKRRRLSEISLSVRDLKPNCIFFCIRYHKLKPKDIENIRANAFFVVTPKPLEGCRNIICETPSVYGRKMLRYLRNLSKVKVIAITGSVGKTSTKEMVESVLRQKYDGKMVASIGNSNSAHKAALYVKRLTYNDKVYLQEVGAGSMAYDIVKDSAVILETDVAIYTNIRDNHIEWYGSRENIAKEKFTLSDFGKKDGLAVINYDDDILRKHKFEQKTLSYSLNNKKADYYAKNIVISSEGTSFTIVDTILNQELDVNLKVIGEHHVLNALVAYIVGKYMNMKDKTILRGIKKYKTSGARQNLIDVGKYKVFADCYNSSYDAIQSIMKTFDVIQPKGKKIAVIGDIFELGDISKETHQKVGKLLAEYKLDKVIFQGTEAKYAYDEYKKLKKNGVYCKTREDLIKTIEKTIDTDDIILFKASHGMDFSGIIDTVFGQDIGEQSALGHHEYDNITEGDFAYNIFKNHATVNEYHGKDKNIKLIDEIEGQKIEKLGKVIFKDNKTIEKIELSKYMVRLRGHCFKNSSLKEIKFNSSLRAIGPGVFYGCNNLKEVKLPEGLLTIEFKAFASCKNLKEVYIPESVMKISGKAFLGTPNVTIKCKKDSFAFNYAKKHDIKCKTV